MKATVALSTLAAVPLIHGQGLLGGLTGGSGAAGSLKEVTDYKSFDSRRSFYISEPATPHKEGGAVLMMLHTCGSSASGFAGMTSGLAQYANSKGHHVVYGQTTFDSRCWDVATKASLTHDGGSDSKNIAGMIKHVISTRKADPKRVFVIGGSSGAMMTNVMAATYPDLIAGASPFSGVPALCVAQSTCPATGCASPMSDKSKCPGATGRDAKFSAMTSKQWGDLARSAYPGYTGPRPKMAIWHGTADRITTYPNYGDTLKQWSDVLGVTVTANQTNVPQSGYTKTVYGDGTKLVGYSQQGGGHITTPRDQANWQELVKFFGL